MRQFKRAVIINEKPAKLSETALVTIEFAVENELLPPIAERFRRDSCPYASFPHQNLNCEFRILEEEVSHFMSFVDCTMMVSCSHLVAIQKRIVCA